MHRPRVRTRKRGPSAPPSYVFSDLYCGSIKSRPSRGVRGAGQSNQGLFEGLERKSFFFSLFLRNNKIIKCLKHCDRFKLTTEDTRNKAFPERGTNTYERDEKKRKEIFFSRFLHEALAEAFFYLYAVKDAQRMHTPYLNTFIPDCLPTR